MSPQGNGPDHPHRTPHTDIEQIGPYKILEQLGEGGAGLVYVADQTEPVRRKVALKLIKPGMDTKQVVARFEAERQALAVMDHLNIATVFDGGVSKTGRPYFVMELVRGVSITEYCDTNKLPIADRLRILADVCVAVQHAHQKGVIHRDLKPSNILVTVQNGKPVPKVIDFGIAKAVGQRLTESTLHTQQGAIIGTPAYMSPEQAAVTGLDIDTRTDIYSLGVVLYELLAGELPFAPKDLEGLAVIATLRDTEPPTPSSRFSSLGDKRSFVAERRRTDPGTLGKKLKGDLDQIAMKAMAKDRTQRYETANGLALDIQRYLNDEPIRARPPSAGYRVRKFIRRHRLGVGFAAVVVMLLAGFGIAVSVQAARIAEERDRANAEAATAEEVTEFLVGLFEVSDPSESRGNTITAREILDKGAERIDQELDNQPVVQGKLLEAMGRVYTSLGLYRDAEPLLEEAVAVRRAALGDEHPDLAVSLRRLASFYQSAGKLDAALRLAQDAVVIDQKASGLDHPATAWSHRVLGLVHRSRGEYEEARRHLEESLATYERALGLDHIETAWSLYHLGWLHNLLGELDTAKARYERALPIAEREFGRDNPSFAHFIADLGVVYDNLGDKAAARDHYERALAIREKSLGPDHVHVAWVLNNLGGLEYTAGDLAKARSYYERSLSIEERAWGPENPALATSLTNLGLTHQRSGEYEEAIRRYRRALAIRETALGPKHVAVARSLWNLGYVLRYIGDFAGARSALERAIAILEEATDANHPDLAHPLTHLGMALYDQADYVSARAYFERALAISEKTYGKDDPAVLWPLSNLADVLIHLGEYEASLALLERAQAIQPDQYHTVLSLGKLFLFWGEPAQGDSLLRRWLEIAAKTNGRETAAFAYAQARYHAISGDREKALEHLQTALDRGYADPWLYRDGDLAPLRSDPRFQAMVAEVKRRAGVVELVP